MNLGDLGSIASIVSLPAAAVSVVAALQSPGMARSLMLIIAVPIAIAAYTIDISDRLGWIKLSETPESEQMKACRTIQTAANDEAQRLKEEIQSAYTTIDNDHKALTEQTRARVAA